MHIRPFLMPLFFNRSLFDFVKGSIHSLSCEVDFSSAQSESIEIVNLFLAKNEVEEFP